MALVSYACRRPIPGLLSIVPAGALVSYAYRRPLPGALGSCACRRRPLSEALLYQINMKYYMKTGITEFWITGVGTRDAGTNEFSNLKTGTLEFGITGGFSNIFLNKKLIRT
jgi:hypothetical protein